MPQVEKVRTTAGVEETRQRFITAWTDRFLTPPSDRVIALLLALWDLETAAGQSMYNWNHGNQIIINPETQQYYLADDSGNLRRFRAYPNANAGAASFVAQVTSDTRPQWRKGLESEDPEFFVESLKGLHGGPAYFEANLDRYMQTFLQRYAKYKPVGITQTHDIASPKAYSPSWLPLGSHGGGQGHYYASLPTISKWSKATSIVAVVQALLNHADAALKIDGIFGPVTEAALRVYQQAQQLEVTNRVDSYTWESLLTNLTE